MMTAAEPGVSQELDARAAPRPPVGAIDLVVAVLRSALAYLIMAIKAQAPVVPIAVQGGRGAMAKGSPIVRPAVVTVRIGPPVETKGLMVADRDRLIAEVRFRIEAMLKDGRT